jgi:sterol desaturase/sphingolipid hydroxylase (fatty acid hydroxylase superfamily)
MDALIDLFAQAQQALFEGLLQPAMFRLGLGNLLADGYRATGWLLVGLLQIVVMLTLMRALERWRPVEPVTDRAAVRTDMVYTLIHRLGLFRVLLFFSVDPFWDWTVGQLHLLGLPSFELDHLWPGITDVAVVSFLVYLLLFDLVDYAYHRLQHAVGWWWQLHAVHHSQRQMTMWSDNRNHLLDDLLRDSVFVLLALGVGVAPGQFVALVALTQLVESLSHANVRLDFGPLRGLLVSPQFHRLHHAIGQGHASAGQGSPGGHNFAVLFPVWDRLFGTARFDVPVQPTGIRDQLEGRDYGSGFWAQQWLGLKRLAGRA